MKGIILAGGCGTRLNPLTLTVTKHLLPVYNKPMIYYPMKTLADAGIKDVMVVVGHEASWQIVGYLKDGFEFRLNSLYYAYQKEPLGIANALSLTEKFVNGDRMTVILGDNLFNYNFKKDIDDFSSVLIKGIEGDTFYNAGAKVFLKKIDDPKRFGVAEIKDNKLIGIEEKPKEPKSNYAVTGCYLYDSSVFEIIKGLKKSDRGEFEISDVNQCYIENGLMDYKIIKGNWGDMGNFDTLLRAGQMTKEKWVD